MSEHLLTLYLVIEVWIPSKVSKDVSSDSISGKISWKHHETQNSLQEFNAKKQLLSKQFIMLIMLSLLIKY